MYNKLEATHIFLSHPGPHKSKADNIYTRGLSTPINQTIVPWNRNMIGIVQEM